MTFSKVENSEDYLDVDLENKFFMDEVENDF